MQSPPRIPTSSGLEERGTSRPSPRKFRRSSAVTMSNLGRIPEQEAKGDTPPPCAHGRGADAPSICALGVGELDLHSKVQSPWLAGWASLRTLSCHLRPHSAKSQMCAFWCIWEAAGFKLSNKILNTNLSILFQLRIWLVNKIFFIRCHK